MTKVNGFLDFIKKNMSFRKALKVCLTAHVGIGDVPLPKVLYHNTISSGPDTSTSANNSTVSLDKSRLPLYLSPTTRTKFLKNWCKYYARESQVQESIKLHSRK